MASEFIGCIVLVTLKSPPNCRIKGEVVDVVGTRLSLQNALLLWNGQHFPLYHIDGSKIADLEISSEPTPQTPVHHRNGHIDSGGYHSSSQHSQPPHPTGSAQSISVSHNTGAPSFVDPAILSFKRPSRQDGRQDANNEVEPATVTSHPISTSPVMLGGSEVPTSAHATHIGHHTRLPATLNAPFSDLELNNPEQPSSIREDIVEQQELEHTSIPHGRAQGVSSSAATQLKPVGKRGKRGGRGKLERDGGETTDITATELHVSATNHGRKGVPGKGWRQTAFIEPIDASPTPNKSKLRARRARAQKENLNGWATEEATDIQELGDFDFQSNLSKFDKRRVFDEIRNDDMTPLEDRLASFNRRPKPGTNGGKNLHYTENVLDSTSQPQTSQWNSEAGETDDDYTVNGRTSSRNRSSRSIPSRKGSGVIASTPSSAQFTILGRSHLSSTRTTSPQPIKVVKHSASSMTGSSSPTGGALHMITTGRKCPSISPLQMVEIEQLAIAELGLTEDIVTENAGRGIAEGAISLATGLRVPSIIVVFVGNHRTGARTVASARHLRNRGYRVSLCVLGNGHDGEFTDGFQKQVDIFQKAGGHVMRWEDLSARFSMGDFKPKLIIDALFGMHVAFEDLRTDDQATAFEIISWVNRSKVDVLSVDVPSGLSATTGETTVTQGSQLAVSSQFVICLGAPKTGLVTALSSRGGESWQIAVADVGISPVAWRKYGTRRRHGVEFGSAWVVPLRFQLPTP
ncbi:YjeF-N domain-containing protein [Nannizzia gypsea CBS 118893]|uniref:Enhancer of mRNA-decapping protein 3 n=1 Tax=Arthroderma gypseum (strain ATCC MYA-4604 / CBS 118893) TaxID=535722 RepID=E4V3V5_ARTGP|nr:YjeF-N domain-containing protein [Nannizzia gypsea CBS 118893]EFR04679.1 YjeF-N domain-containing protein [Nannizzia gypsea CBS 118893]